jgi:hypothetical protein
MKTTITLNQFRQAFVDAGRCDQFTYNGLRILFDYFEQLEDETGEEIELGVIAICCDYSEDTPEDIAKAYNIDLSNCKNDEEKMQAVIDYLNIKTSVIGSHYKTIVYQQF